MASLFRRLLWYCECVIAMTLFNALPKLIERLRPRTYFRSRRVRTAIDGSATYDSGRYAIYAIKQPESLPWYVLEALQALNSQRINTYVVSNASLSTSQIDTLRRYASRIIVRDGSGRDFGSYKDAIAELITRTDLSRLMLFNDSVYVLPNRATLLFEQLFPNDNDDAIVATNENFETRWHLQSFALSFPARVVAHPAFCAFWRRYKPLTPRRYVIRRGEIALSRALLKTGAELRVIYSLPRLQEEIRRLGPIAFCDRRALPTQYRDLLPHSLVANTNSQPLGGPFKFALTWELAATICEAIDRGPQLHYGGFLFAQFLQGALLKRDIVYRGWFTHNEVLSLLLQLGIDDDLHNFRLDLLRKGTRHSLSWIDKIKYDFGIV